MPFQIKTIQHLNNFGQFKICIVSAGLQDLLNPASIAELSWAYGRVFHHVFEVRIEFLLKVSSMILLFYHLLLQQNNALVMSICMQLHFSEERGKYHGGESAD